MKGKNKFRKNKFENLIPFEQSRKTIHLEKRGPEQNKHIISSHIFRVLGFSSILYCVGIALVGFGTYFFLIWGIIGAASLSISAFLRSHKLMKALPKWLKIVCTVFFWLGLSLFCIVEGLIFTEYRAGGKPNADFCLVLGAQWKAGGPSEVLRRRLDKAAAYLMANPNTKVIVSGGQGGNEPVSEAAGMREYLINAGVSEERILMEDQSSNTYENLVFSGELLDKTGDSIVIVTNNFHMFRALAIARKQGYVHVEGLAADSLIGMAPNNLLREFFGVVKDFMLTNL